MAKICFSTKENTLIWSYFYCFYFFGTSLLGFSIFYLNMGMRKKSKTYFQKDADCYEIHNCEHSCCHTEEAFLRLTIMINVWKRYQRTSMGRYFSTHFFMSVYRPNYWILISFRNSIYQKKKQLNVNKNFLMLLISKIPSHSFFSWSILNIFCLIFLLFEHHFPAVQTPWTKGVN